MKLSRNIITVFKSEYEIASTIMRAFTGGNPHRTKDVISTFFSDSKASRNGKAKDPDYSTFRMAQKDVCIGSNQNSRTNATSASFLESFWRQIQSHRRKRREVKDQTKFSNVLAGGVASIGERDFHGSYVSSIAMEIRDWRPRSMQYVKPKVVMHTSLHSFNSKDPNELCYTPYMAKLRVMGSKKNDQEHIPLIASDRFILDYILCGKPYVPSFIHDGDVVQVRFIDPDNKFKVTEGWLARSGNDYGCSATESGAIRAAKIRNVKRVKKTLGLL